MHSIIERFDFDEWVELAKDDPVTFEKRRTEWLESVIQKSPENNKTRLRGLQFQIDMVREKHRHPLGACMKLSSMMLESLYRETPLVADIPESGEKKISVPTALSEIIPFCPRNEQT